MAYFRNPEAKARMIQRRFEILKRLLDKGRVHKSEVAKLVPFPVQSNSIDGDFRFLKDQFYRIVHKTDATLSINRAVEGWPHGAFADRFLDEAGHIEGYQRIGRTVVSALTKKHQKVCCIASGIAAHHVAEEVAQAQLSFRIASNNLPLMRALSYSPQVKLYALGGHITADFDVLDEDMPQQLVRAGMALQQFPELPEGRLPFDACILDAPFIDLERLNIYSRSPRDMRLRKAMLSQSHNWYVPFHHSRLQASLPTHLQSAHLPDLLEEEPRPLPRAIYVATDLDPESSKARSNGTASLVKSLEGHLQQLGERVHRIESNVQVFLCYEGGANRHVCKPLLEQDSASRSALEGLDVDITRAKES